MGTAIQDTGIEGNAIYDLTVFKGELYAGGGIYNHCPTNNIARWNGIKWDSLGSGTRDTGVLALCAYDSLLFVGGQFNAAGGLPAKGIAQWDGTKWDTVGPGLDGIFGVYSICVYKGEVYAGGQFYFTSKTNRKLYCIAKWNGTYWDSVGAGMNGHVWAMTVYNGELYVGGYFTMAGNVKAYSIAKWDGSKWDSLGSGVGNSDIYALTVYNGKLYAGGDFINAGGVPSNNVASWDGVKWDSLSSGLNNWVRSLVVYNGNLYAGGIFTTAGGMPASEIAKWNGIKWDSAGAGLSASGAGQYGVLALGVYDTSLYAGGDFTKSGATTVMGIARWRDTLTAVNEIKIKNEECKVFPNPSSSYLNIQVNLQQSEIAYFYLFNNMGQSIQEIELKNNLTKLPINNLESGIYFYRVIDSKGNLLRSGKQMIVH